jgi:hypothetical protein
MSKSHSGRQRSLEVRAKMAAAQAARRARERAARGGGGGAVGSDGGAGSFTNQQSSAAAASAPQLRAGLAREAAVIELARLRQQVAGWMEGYERSHGRQPSLPETAELNPDIYRAFVRYVALRDSLRSSGGGGGSGMSGRAGSGPVREPGGRP